jgi:hypothetical protein
MKMRRRPRVKRAMDLKSQAYRRLLAWRDALRRELWEMVVGRLS